MSAAPPARLALVVDDDPSINRLVQVRVTRAGFTALSAANGQEALEHLDGRDGEALPDLLFLDVSMPGLGGLELLDIVRSRGLDLAVIMMTAFGSEQVAIDALRRGADDYLRKPFAVSEFESVLTRTVRHLELLRQNAALRRQLDAELAQAASIQAELLPREYPALSGFQLAARCVVAREVSGDFYDW